MILNDILKAEYKTFVPSAIDGECVKRLFQKRFTDKVGVKYFITIKEWDFSRYGMKEPIQYESTVQLTKKQNGGTLDLEFFNDWELSDVENFVEKIWKNHGFEYYEKWSKNNQS